MYDSTTPVIVTVITEGLKNPTNAVSLELAERAVSYPQWKVPPVR